MKGLVVRRRRRGALWLDRAGMVLCERGEVRLCTREPLGIALES